MTATPALRPAPRAGFALGYTSIAAGADADAAAAPDAGMDFGIRRCAQDEVVRESDPKETAWVLLEGRAEVEVDGRRATVQRSSLFDDAPTALHVCGGTPIVIRSLASGSEWAVIRTRNSAKFAAQLLQPADLAPEYRGAGLVQNAALRNVRLIFDRASCPASNLVVGEVVNFPGRWSSYPPHHHAQPEIYHYRFTSPEGYGHAEHGEDVHKVRQGDSLLIAPGRDHAQVAAPGYGMYYLWFIRHLPGNPYTGFTFAPEHQWALDAGQQGWRPRDLPPGLS